MADFIGSINFFDGTVAGADGHTVSIDAGPLGRIAVPDGAVPEFARGPGTELLVALRPEKIHLSAKRHGEGDAVKGTIHTAAYLGERSHFHVTVEGLATPIAVAAQNVERDIADNHRSGATVYLSWQPGALVLLER